MRQRIYATQIAPFCIRLLGRASSRCRRGGIAPLLAAYVEASAVRSCRDTRNCRREKMIWRRVTARTNAALNEMAVRQCYHRYGATPELRGW